VFGNPLAANLDRAVAGQGGVADPPEHGEIDQMIGPKLLAPLREVAAQALGDSPATVEFDAVALAIIKADRLDRSKAGKGPGEAGRRILPAGKQHQRRPGWIIRPGWFMGQHISTFRPSINKPPVMSMTPRRADEQSVIRRLHWRNAVRFSALRPLV
jgi:hypothetical protein